MASEYAETIVDTIIKLLKTNLPDNFFKHYYYGYILEIPNTYLPCIMVKNNATTVIHGATGTDVLTHDISITLVIDTNAEKGKSPHEVTGQRTLEQYAEGKDPVNTRQYHEKSIAGILRTNFTLNNRSTDQELEINYGFTPRPGAEPQITTECEIKCTIEEQVIVPVRT